MLVCSCGSLVWGVVIVVVVVTDWSVSGLSVDCSRG